MELEEFKNFARTRLPFLLSRISGLKTTNTRNVHSSFGGTSNLGAAQKLQWTDALKQKLYSALEELMRRYQRIGPKTVCDEMGVPEVTRDNVASYLQRVRKDEVNQSDLSMRLWKYEKEIIPTVDYYKNTEHQLPATRPRRAEEGIKEVAKFQSENLYAMELKHEHQHQYLLRSQNAEVQEKIDAGISNEYLRRIQDVHRQVMLRLIEQHDAEKEGFTKRCEAQLKRLKEEEEQKKHLKEEEEVRRFGDDNEDERRSEHPEVIELLSDDDDE
jgi:SHAQKYF class myb-like DNA-binding protein